MATGFFTRIAIADERLYHDGGDVKEWLRGVGKEMSRNSKAACPVRTGNLKRSVRMSIRGSLGVKLVETTIGTNMPYANYVLKGTTGPIMSDKLWSYGGVLRKGRGLVKISYRRRNKKTNRMKTFYRWVPEPGTALAVGRNPWPPVTPRFEVRGQRPHNFLARGYRLTAARHPGLPSNSPV